jgi:hypothetical protein
MIRRQSNKIILSMWLLASLFWQTIPVRAQQQTDQLSVVVQEATSQNGNQIFKNLLRQGRGAEYPVVLEKIFGSEAETMADAFDEDSEQLFQAVTTGRAGKPTKVCKSNQRAQGKTARENDYRAGSKDRAESETR